MRSIAALVLALLVSGTALTDAVDAHRQTNAHCPQFTLVDAPGSSSSVLISVSELRCLGVEITDLTPWSPFFEQLEGPRDAQHVAINKHTLGFLTLLTRFIRSKAYSAGAETVLTIDGPILEESEGRTLAISKEPDQKDYRLQLQRPRNMDILWMIKFHEKSGDLKFQDSQYQFQVTPLARPEFENEYTTTFHPPTVVTVSR